MRDFNLAQVNQFVLRKQHLTADSAVDDVVQMAHDIAGLHATGSMEPYVATFTRSRRFTRESLDEALTISWTLVKVRYVRATLYILPRKMVPVAHTALGQLVEDNSRRYAEFRGVSPADYERVHRKILSLLENRALTVNEIKNRINETLHFPSLLNLMCDRGLLLRVQSGHNWKVRSYRYAIFKECLPDVDLNTLTETEAITLLVHAYLRAFGPAAGDDIAWWTGLSKAKIYRALEQLHSRVSALRIQGLEGDFLILKDELEALKNTVVGKMRTVNFLPDLDPYLMGYKHRDRYLDSEVYSYVFDRSGNATSTILLDGRVAGVWDFADGASMKLFLFEKPGSSLLKRMGKKAGDMAQFIAGGEVEIRHVSGMKSLALRTAGGFMSPLKEQGD